MQALNTTVERLYQAVIGIKAEQLWGSGFPCEGSAVLGSECGLISRHDAVEHEILKGPQDAHVFCSSFMVPVLRITVLSLG